MIGSQRTAWRRGDAATQHVPGAIDLRCSNPSELGLVHAPELLHTLATPAALVYRPEPLGLASARAAVCEHYAARGISLVPDDVWVCAGTSEAYTQWMWLTCDPGEVWWVPQPGYRLLEVIARLAGVELRGYPLRFDGRWSIDLDALRHGVEHEPRSRAVVVVAPGNPTGSYLAHAELAALASLCTERQLVLVVDEVFAEHDVEVPADRVRHVAGPLGCAVVVLSGLSKVAALPQLKLAWGAWHGPASQRAAWFDRLAHIADAYLSAASPVQLALPALLAAGDELRPRIAARVGENLAAARALLAGTTLDVLPVEGGWTLLLRLPAIGGHDDAAWSDTLARDAGVLVQPGWLFDVPAPPRIALSLLTVPELFARGVSAIAEHVARTIRG